MHPMLVHHLIEQTAARLPNKVAVRHLGRDVTYGELLEESRRIKEFLLKEGVRTGDRVGIYLDKSVEQLMIMFAVSMAGGVFVFINPVLRQEQIEYIVKDCEIRLLVTTGVLARKSRLDIPGKFLFVDEEELDGFPCWPYIREKFAPNTETVRRIADDTACLIYTSGSTGMPKGVVVPHRTVVEGAEIVSGYLEITEQDRIISVLPFNFDYGLNQATSSILRGATLVMHQFIFAKDLLNLLRDEEITGFAGMTPIWAKLFGGKHALKSEMSFPRLRYITNTGGKVPRVIVDRIREFFPESRLYLMYGLTEAFRSTFLPPEELDRRPDSIGRAIPNVEILVVNEKGEECNPGEPGELVHRGALITRGYWNDPEKTRLVFRVNPLLNGQGHLNETVVYSGDLVKKDEEGFLYFISRRDEMIKTSGYRVSPTEVEEILVGIPGITNAVVFGKEMASGDQAIVAVVETTAVDVKTILADCRQRLPSYMVPHEINREREFPKTANGKIDRSYLKRKWQGNGEE
ncbi:MAG TPA: acyl-CoA ligase (AMP-forming), exosortase A system-associated [Geobacteraceae bacterium]|nr:acyl-CoA ligase (AMP-forming), exosortase A system-associated [Geobacteraceae bacterium]